MKSLLAISLLSVSAFAANENQIVVQITEKSDKRIDLEQYKINLKVHYVSPHKFKGSILRNMINPCKDDIVKELEFNRNVNTDALGVTYPFKLQLPGTQRFCGYQLVQTKLGIENKKAYTYADSYKYYEPGKHFVNFNWKTPGLVVGEVTDINMVCDYITAHKYTTKLALKCNGDRSLSGSHTSQLINLNLEASNPKDFSKEK